MRRPCPGRIADRPAAPRQRHVLFRRDRTDAGWVVRRLLTEDDGAVAGAESIVFGVLVFVVGSLLALNVWGVIDAKFVANAAAREATRVVVEAVPGDDLMALATAAMRTTVEDYDKNPDRATLTALEPPVLQRCGTISFSVTYDSPVTFLPWVGEMNDGLAFQVTSRYSETIDPFRSGLPIVGGVEGPCGP